MIIFDHHNSSFCLFLGTDGRTVAALFRAIGAHYLDHFSLVLLHGLCLNPRDPDCKVGNLYPVSGARKMAFKGNRYRPVKEKGKAKGKKQGKNDFSEVRGKFCKAEFPETYKLWEQAVREDETVQILIKQTEKGLELDPKFERDSPLDVAFSTKRQGKKLMEVPFGATFASTEEDLRKYHLRAVNVDGSLLYKIGRSGRKDNIAVVLAIKDVCGKVGSGFPTLPMAIKAIVVNFVRAVVVAGLPKGESHFFHIIILIMYQKHVYLIMEKVYLTILIKFYDLAEKWCLKEPL